MSQSSSTPFERIIAEFKKDLTPDELKQFQATTLKDLQEEITIIQRRQAKTKTMRNMARIKGFLEAMEMYTKMFDIFVNVHDFVAFIWGPVKLLLLVTSAFSDAFSGLLDAYQRIAQALPLLEQYQSLFETDARVQHVLERTFRSIFDFHRMAIRYFRKPAWKQLFHATWSKFNTSFGTIIDDLKQHRALLVEQATLEQFRRMESDRTTEVARFQAQEQYERVSRRKHVAAWLSAADVHADQERGSQAREGHPNSCQWLFRKDAFRAWHQGISEPLLWIHGIPGCGKSVLASFVVEEAQKLPSTTVVYFYCRHNDTQRNSFVAMARSIIWELSVQDDTLVDHIFDVSTKSVELLQLKTQKLARQLLATALDAAGTTYIVLDGLDECDPLEQKHVVLWFRKYVESAANGSALSRCVFFSQYDAATKSLFPKVPALRLSSTDNRADIGAYAITWSRAIERKFGPGNVDVHGLASLATTRAEGMFLFARLVMNHLFDQTNPHSVKTEMHFLFDPSSQHDRLDERIPGFFKHLYVAYSRIVQSILVEAPEPRKEDAGQLIKWLVCSIRPLTWREIQSALSIDVNEQAVNHARRRTLDAKDLCGSLVDVGKHGQVELVHSTAKKYLEVMGHVFPPDEHLALANLCMNYFCLLPLATDLSNEKLDEYIWNGSYGFLDYSAAHWATHVELGLQSRSEGRQVPPALLSELEETLDVFLEMQWHKPQENLKIPRDLVSIVHALRNISLHSRTLATLACMRKISSAETAQMASYSTCKLLTALPRVRERTETLAESNPACFYSKLEEYYGLSIYKCSRLYCQWFYIGFSDAQKRKEHVEKHERSFYCPHENCLSAKIGMSTKRELETHLAAYHKTRDGFSGAQDEKSQDDTLEKSVKAKGPLIFQCTLCPKRFTRAHNLRVHLRSHTDERPFVCTVCGKAFAAQTDRKRHEKLHSGEREFACRGALLAGNHWGCGRRFTRADALGRHFRSEAGKVCIKLLLDEEAAERQKAWMEEQQVKNATALMPDTQSSASISAAQFLPAALIQQYPALAGIDWNSMPQPPDEAYTEESQFDLSSGGGYSHNTPEGIAAEGTFGGYGYQDSGPFRDWSTFQLENFQGVSGAEVDSGMYGPSLEGQDMLDLLLNPVTGNQFQGAGSS